MSLDFRGRLKGFLESLISDPRSPFLYLGKRLLDMLAKQVFLAKIERSVHADVGHLLYA
jgi:hypothetical protein